jgi:CelD/BcsL family acetyltransferase involved in cellulose biosynthesis
MNVAIGRTALPKSAALQVSPRPGVIRRLEICDNFAAAAPCWRALERVGALTTPYQGYDFLHSWYRHLGERAGVKPFLVIGYDADETTVLLCPFGVFRQGPLRTVSFLGGRHANFNVALWRRDVAALIGQSDLATILLSIAAAGTGHEIDLLSLTDQPRSWDGISNPFLFWPHLPSPSFGYRGTLAADFENVMRRRLGYAARKKMRKKLRSLATHGPVDLQKAATPEQVHAILDIFCTQKAERMRELGVSNVFAARGTREFIEELATNRPHEGAPVIEIYALSVGDTIVATIGGMVGGSRFCALFNSITSGPLAHYSPGYHLLCRLIQACCERGLTCFDLGVGDARYKRMFCDEVEPLFDSFVPLTPLGRLAAAGFRSVHDAKRVIKGSPALWRIVQTLRHIRGRMFFAR